jgi:hypothetical protein
MIEVLETMGIPLFLLGCVAVGSSVPLRGVSRVLALGFGLCTLGAIQVIANA